MSLFTYVSEFIRKYYLDPIVADSGYNIVNTLTWALILGIAVYFLIRLFSRASIRIDRSFIAATMPFVIGGASLRVVADAGIVKAPWVYFLITPNIYFLIFLIAACCLLVSVLLQYAGAVKRFHVPFALSGFVFTVVVLATLFLNCRIAHPWVPFAVLSGGLLVTGLVMAAARFLKSGIYAKPSNLSLFLAHALDATSTVIGIEVFGYYEKHVIPSYLIDLTGTAFVMYPLKIVVFLIVVYALDVLLKDDAKDGSSKEAFDIVQMRNSLKFVIIVLGLAPAIRNTLRIFFGI